MNQRPEGEVYYISDTEKAKIEEVAAVSDSFPGVIIIHSVKDFRVQYMSQTGLNQLNATLSEIRSMTAEEYHDIHFNPEDAKDYVPKIRQLAAANTDETITFFQQVRITKDQSYTWHMSAMKVLMRDDRGLPSLLITTSIAIDAKHHITQKVSRLLEENNFLKKNYSQFLSLGKREKQILAFMARGKSSVEIAAELFISAATVDTHRRNIKQKLNANSPYELAQYARAFDLI